LPWRTVWHYDSHRPARGREFSIDVTQSEPVLALIAETPEGDRATVEYPDPGQAQIAET
jgi:hypothetical protein